MFPIAWAARAVPSGLIVVLAHPYRAWAPVTSIVLEPGEEVSIRPRIFGRFR